MNIVTEVMSSEPLDRPARTIRRDEARLFESPPEPIMKAMGEPFAPLAVYEVPIAYLPAPFGRPQGVFEGETLRLEWQQMNARQPFYHRNADVDEIGYQICGERTLMTECGSVEFKPGQFSRIPLGRRARQLRARGRPLDLLYARAPRSQRCRRSGAASIACRPSPAGPPSRRSRR